MFADQNINVLHFHLQPSSALQAATPSAENGAQFVPEEQASLQQSQWHLLPSPRLGFHLHGVCVCVFITLYMCVCLLVCVYSSS